MMGPLRGRRSSRGQRLRRARMRGQLPATAGRLVHRAAHEWMAEAKAPRLVGGPDQIGGQHGIERPQRILLTHAGRRTPRSRIQTGRRPPPRPEPRARALASSAEISPASAATTARGTPVAPGVAARRAPRTLRLSTPARRTGCRRCRRTGASRAAVPTDGPNQRIDRLPRQRSKLQHISAVMTRRAHATRPLRPGRAPSGLPARAPRHPPAAGATAAESPRATPDRSNAHHRAAPSPDAPQPAARAARAPPRHENWATVGATDTRELGPGEARDRLLALIDARVDPARAPSVREFAQAYLRRSGAEEAGEPPVPVLLDEIVSLFEFVAGRGREKIAVRAFTPPAGPDGSPAGSVLETNTEDLPFLVDSVTAELHDRGIAAERVLHPIIGVERDATGRITRVRRPRDAIVRESVMHFDLDRRLGLRELGQLEEGVRSVLDAVRRSVQAFPALKARVSRMIRIAGAAEGPERGGDRRDRRVPRLARAGQLHLPRLPRVRHRPGRDRGRRRLGPGVARGRRGLRVRAAGRARRAAPAPARARDERRGADRLEDEPPLPGAPPCADGLRGRASRRGRADRRRGPPDRALHDQGVRVAGRPDAVADAQAASDPCRRGPDRGLARLQGGGLAVRVLPEGRAVRRTGRGPAPRDRGAARPPGPRGAPARPPRRRRQQRVADRGAARRALGRGADRPADGAAAPALRHRPRRGPRGGRRGRAGARPHHGAPRRRPARRRPARPPARGGRAHALVAGPPARGARPAPRAAPGRGARRALGASLPGPLPHARRPRPRRAHDRLLRPPGGPQRAVRRRSAAGARRRAHAARALQVGRQDRALARDADARGPRPPGRRGGRHAPARRGAARGVGAGVPRPRPRRLAAGPRRVRRARGRRDRRRVARRQRVRHAERAGPDRRPRLASGHAAARLPPLPAAHRLALHRGLPERRADGQPGGHGEARALLRAALRPPRAAAARPPRPRCARRSSPTSRPSRRSTTTASCATSCSSSTRPCARTPTAATAR